MRIGLGVMSSTSVADACDEVARARDEGFESAWFSNIFGLEALTAAALAGRSVDGIEVGTFVVPIYTRHPMTLAQQAVTAQDACSGRFVLGVGLSHQVVVESMMGVDFSRPLRAMREYLSVVVPLLQQGSVSFSGEVYRVNAVLECPEGFVPPPVLVAALGPKMLELAGRMADGTATWMTGPSTLNEFTVPTIRTAAAAAERPQPRVTAGLPVCVTADVEGARDRAGRIFSVYGGLPSYRAMLDREGVGGPADVAVVGDEEAVAAVLERLAAAGVSDFVAAPFGSSDEIAVTRRLLTSGRFR